MAHQPPNAGQNGGSEGRTCSAEYLLDGRLYSYAHQLQTVLAFESATVLEVGAAGGVVAASLRAVGSRVVTLDVDPKFRSDMVGSVTAIPARDDAFDAALCCQVLEHLPLERFQIAMSELRRVTRRGLVLSLPDITRCFYLSWRLPKSRPRHIEWNKPLRNPPLLPPANHQATGHHWEIGYRGCSLPRVSGLIREAGWTIARTWRVPEKPWHRFFDLRRRP